MAVGPRDADPGPALAALARLVADAGAVAAGAGVELAPGFVSARLEGAHGDRRDAVLAALRAVDPARLGERAGLLVALFGTSATKPVGAAAEQAIAEQRWGTLQLASAASDLLGPEQLERLLALDVDATRATASVMATHLRTVLGPYPQRRRLDLLLDLCAQVSSHQELERRRERILATQGRQSRLADLRARYAQHQDVLVLADVRGDLGHEPTLAEAARWKAESWHWWWWLRRALADALAATALLRTAVAVADHGVEEGLARCRASLEAAAAMLNDDEAGLAARRVPGLAGLPARPGCYARDLLRPRGESFALQRVARARDYGLVVLEAVTSFLETVPAWLGAWDGSALADWRAAAGFTEQRPPAAWTQSPLGNHGEPLAARPPKSEIPGDLLWLAELADALAVLHGHDAAMIENWQGVLPSIDVDPRPEPPDPLTPRFDSIPLAVAGVAQLVSLGGAPPARCRSWRELADSLMGSAEIAEAMTGAFRLPEPLAAWEGRVVPGTRLRVQWAHDPRMLARWSSYMGNCIAGPGYVEAATKGESMLAALLDRDGQIALNVEIVRGRGAWRVEELRARFNADPEPALEKQVERWAKGLPAPEIPAAPAVSHPPRGPRGRRPRLRLFAEVGEPLSALASAALADSVTVAAVGVLEELYGGPVPLRRLGPDRLAAVCRDGLTSVGLARLWSATASRPLERALAELAYGERLDPLLDDTPLLGSLRTLAKQPAIAQARTIELVARRIRAAIGSMARSGEPVLDSGPGVDALCALVVAATSWQAPGPLITLTEASGFPASRLDDEVWQRALLGARELGADLAAFHAHGGLAVPAAWLGRGGWPALWSRAKRDIRHL